MRHHRQSSIGWLTGSLETLRAYRIHPWVGPVLILTSRDTKTVTSFLQS